MHAFLRSPGLVPTNPTLLRLGANEPRFYGFVQRQAAIRGQTCQRVTYDRPVMPVMPGWATARTPSE